MIIISTSHVESKSSLSLVELPFKMILFNAIIFMILTDRQILMDICSFVLLHSLLFWPFCPSPLHFQQWEWTCPTPWTSSKFFSAPFSVSGPTIALIVVHCNWCFIFKVVPMSFALLCEWHKTMDHFPTHLIFLACPTHHLGVEEVLGDFLILCKILFSMKSCYVSSGMTNFQPEWTSNPLKTSGPHSYVGVKCMLSVKFGIKIYANAY